MVPASLRCRATSRPEPRSRPPCGVGVAAAAGLTRRRAASAVPLTALPRRRSRQVAHGLLPVVCYLLPAAPVCRLLPWPTAVCYLRPSICCPSRPLPSVCRSLSTVCCLLPAAFRLPTAVYRLLPVACRLLPAALADRICHLLPAACCLGRPPSAAPAERRTSPPATTPTLPPIRPIDATIGIAPAPLSDMPPQFRMQFPEDSHPRRPTNRRISTI